MHGFMSLISLLERGNLEIPQYTTPPSSFTMSSRYVLHQSYHESYLFSFLMPSLLFYPPLGFSKKLNPKLSSQILFPPSFHIKAPISSRGNSKSFCFPQRDKIKEKYSYSQEFKQKFHWFLSFQCFLGLEIMS